MAAGVIAELNPLHNGHRHLLSAAQKYAPDGVVVVLGGNFTQRGTPALLSKFHRTKMALACGADLVLELPLPFSVATAERFAYGGVQILNALGVVDTIVFGSECGSAEALQKTALALETPAVQKAVRDGCRAGASYPAAQAAAVQSVCGENAAAVLQTPNDSLGVAYCRAAAKLQARLKPIAVQRVGAPHNAAVPIGAFASASALRAALRNGDTVEKWMPASAFAVLQAAIQNGEAPADYRRLEIAVLGFLRTADTAAFAEVPDAEPGVVHRILSAARTAQTLWEVFDAAKTRCYTHARIRRVVLSAFLGVRTAYVQGGVPYLRVLGFTARGESLLRTAAKQAHLPTVLRARTVKDLSPTAQAVFALECKSTDIFNLSLPKIQAAGAEMTAAPVRV